MRLRTNRNGFTLIEIMIVVTIMAIVMTMSVPMIYHILHKEGLRKSVADVFEVCQNARRFAITQGTMTEVVFHPKERRFEVAGAGASRSRAEGEGEGAMPADTNPAHATPGSGMSGQFSDNLTIEMLDVNLIEYRDADVARVRFYPNGTCDELTLILHSDLNEWRKIWLEVTTGLADVETDPQKFK